MKKPLFKVGRVHKCDYVIDRTSVLGNPFRMHTEVERASVCDQFNIYFEDRIKNNDPDILNELIRIKSLSIDKDYVVLGCHCAPKQCHGDTIAFFLNNFWYSI